MSIWAKFNYEMEFYYELAALQEIEDKGYEPKWASYNKGQFIVFAKKKSDESNS